VIEADVSGDAVEPGGQAGLTPEGRQATMSPNESFLGQVLGLGLVLSHSQQVVVDWALVFMEDIGKIQRLTSLALYISRHFDICLLRHNNHLLPDSINAREMEK